MTRWNTVYLGDVADVVMGQSPPGETYNENSEGLPFFQGKADFGERFPTVRKWCAAPKKIAEPGDILLSVRAPVGPTNVARERSCIGRGLAAIRGNPERVDQSYLRLYLNHREQRLAVQGQGSTFPAIGRADIEELDLHLPDLEEQRRIVEILDQADRLRGLRCTADAKADRVLAALFLKMFGDPATNPARWKTRRVGDLCQVVSGATPKTNRDQYWGGSVPWATPKDLSSLNDWVLCTTARTITEVGFKSCSAAMLPEGSVLLSSRAPIGLVAINSLPVCTNQGFKSLVCGPDIDPWYLFAWCKLQTRFLQSLGHGATFKEVSKRIIEAVQIPLPPMADQAGFRARMQDLHKVRGRTREARTRTSALFDQLLARAFSGSLTTAKANDCAQTADAGKPRPEPLEPSLQKRPKLAVTPATAQRMVEPHLRLPQSLDAPRSLTEPIGPLGQSIGHASSRAAEDLALSAAAAHALEGAAGSVAARALEDAAFSAVAARAQEDARTRLAAGSALDQAVMHRMESMNAALRRLAADWFSDQVLKRTAADIARAHSSWIRDVGSSLEPQLQIQARAQVALETSSRMAAVAAEIGGRLDATRLFSRYDAQLSKATRSLASLDSLTSAFDRLTGVTESLRSFTALPSFVLPSASRELVATGHSLASLAPEPDETGQDAIESLAEIREETEIVGQLLRETDPALTKIYRGAKEALAGRSADRARHVLVSMRELWSHLLHTLAPDDQVDPWLVDQASDLTHNGKPTRRARLLYLCREFDQQPLGDFVDSDSKAFLHYLDLFHRIHQLEPDFTDQQLQALVLRTDSWLLFLLQIDREGREC